MTTRVPVLKGRTGSLIAMAGSALLVFACARSVPSRDTVELHIASDGDELAFKPSQLHCRAGAHVRLVFDHTGEILNAAHDWVLLKPGTRDAFLAEAIKHVDETISTYDTSMVLAATPLCAKGHSVVVEFTAPAPGDYVFVCSLPGHGETMQGILRVT